MARTGRPNAWNVTAPVPGVVLKVTQESETIVQPGTPLMEIGDPRDLEIVVDVLSTDAVEIRPGADVTIEHWGGPGTLSGRVRRVEPAAFTKVSTLGVEEQRVNVLIDMLSPPEQWTGLGDGYQVDTRITVFVRDDIDDHPDRRTVPPWRDLECLCRRRRTRPSREPSTLLRRSGRFAAVATGLAPGERVIVYPSDRISPGVRVSWK